MSGTSAYSLGRDTEPPAARAVTWLSPARGRPWRRQRDAEYTAGLIGLPSIMEGLDVVGQRGQYMPTEAAGCDDVVGVARRGSLNHQFVVPRVDDDGEHCVRSSRA